MIITFDLRNTDATSGDYMIVDKASNVRVTDLYPNEVFLKYKETFKFVQQMPDYVCKWWELKAGIVKVGEEHPHTYLLEFDSNDKHYFVITEGKTYIANEEDITIKTLN